jgi:Protein of unknown function (DUF3341)
MAKEKGLYGLMAEFTTPEALVHAAHEAHEHGYREMDAYSPMPIEELHHAMHMKDSIVPKITITGGICGCLGGFGLLIAIAMIWYPHNVGGRPWYSWPSFIPITFELTVLLASLATVFGMLALNGLPEPYHPVFNNPRFSQASQDRFFFCIEAKDPKFNLEQTREFMETLHAFEVTEVSE